MFTWASIIHFNPRPSGDSGTAMDCRPSTFNILKRHYIKVLKLNEYIKEKVSEARYAKLLNASRENNELKQLLEATYVCVNPKLHLDEEDDGLDYPSILSTGDNATQPEVDSLSGISLTKTVNRVLSVLLTRRGTTGNVLCQGYKKVHFDFSLLI